jgi:CRP-like cAMP-binding protein
VGTHPFLVALRPVAKALGATIVPPTRMHESDIPLHWEGALVGGLRVPDLQDALARLIAAVEQQLGGPLASLSRDDKQRAVRMLEERGAFQIRKSIEDIADTMGVSRITVYNYLNAIRDRAAVNRARVDGRAS